MIVKNRQNSVLFNYVQKECIHSEPAYGKTHCQKLPFYLIYNKLCPLSIFIYTIRAISIGRSHIYEHTHRCNKNIL